jgi:hypothetical protein
MEPDEEVCCRKCGLSLNVLGEPHGAWMCLVCQKYPDIVGEVNALLKRIGFGQEAGE